MTPLEAEIERGPEGLRITLPIRAEHVTVEKQTVVYEEVEIRRELVEEIPPDRSGRPPWISPSV
ncbi:MAG TPA: DUF2382 domain-containing protein [Chloroflexota bacterium]|nr:DUF2382 domain-containing protein [Chloroflexota bacterium]